MLNIENLVNIITVYTVYQIGTFWGYEPLFKTYIQYL